ncbi:heterokaryon incompatibility protein-domain-containing protein [Xylariales sp. AK1849]|nr:heterokaryon incompatibility protein-domain-containing protein [Xylariales sp. AK1849]
MLCVNCQRPALLDDSPDFQIEIDDSGACRVLAPDDTVIPTDYFLLDHLPELPNLRKSTSDGCQFCSFLRETILSKDTANCLQKDYKLQTTSLDKQEIVVKVQYRWNMTSLTNEHVGHFLVVTAYFVNLDAHVAIYNDIRAVEKNDPIAKWFCLDGLPNRNFAHATNISWIKTCISTCRKHNHPMPTPNFTPKLLLDVRGKTPKLIDRDALVSSWRARGQLEHQTPRYAALSYCWGTADDAKVQLTTTTSSFLHRQTGIQAHDMSPVLRDAISVTKRLSIPYLWIDSLCILQDDIADWHQQCTDMDKIYGHAEITIVAASSSSCREGFI